MEKRVKGTQMGLTGWREGWDLGLEMPVCLNGDYIGMIWKNRMWSRGGGHLSLRFQRGGDSRE